MDGSVDERGLVLYVSLCVALISILRRRCRVD